MIYFITFCFIVLDYFTGLVQAIANKVYSSCIARKGLFHKLSLVLCIALGVLIDAAQQYNDLFIRPLFAPV